MFAASHVGIAAQICSAVSSTENKWAVSGPWGCVITSVPPPAQSSGWMTSLISHVLMKSFPWWFGSGSSGPPEFRECALNYREHDPAGVFTATLLGGSGDRCDGDGEAHDEGEGEWAHGVHSSLSELWTLAARASAPATGIGRRAVLPQQPPDWYLRVPACSPLARVSYSAGGPTLRRAQPAVVVARES